MQIRQLDEHDAEAFRNLRLRGLREHPEAFLASYEDELSTPVEDLAERLRHSTPGEFYLGAFIERQLVGMARFDRQKGRKVEHRAYIGEMYVLPERRAAGIGRALLDRLIEYARTVPGIEELGLWVITGNERALAIYEAAGFETFCVEPRALKIEGRYYDAIGMLLRF